MNAPAAPYISLQDVVKTFPAPGGEVMVLKHIHLDIQPGEYVSIVGKSGSGKSTLLNMITGIDHPTSGTVTVAGTQPHRLSESQLAGWRGVTIGIVFQFFQLLPMLSLLENVMLPMDFCNRYPPAEREGRARALLEQVGLGEMVDKLPGAVSGGQQQAAAIARALANDPPLIVADEPTGNLDERTAEGVLALFDDLVARGKTVVIVTHDPALVKRTQRTILLSDGEIVNPFIAQALPRLSHPQLLQLTHLARPQTLSRGESLNLPPYAPGLLVLTQGKLALWKPARRGETLWRELRPAQALTAQDMAFHTPLRLQALEDSAWLEIPTEAWETWLAQSGARASLAPVTEKRA